VAPSYLEGAGIIPLAVGNLGAEYGQDRGSMPWGGTEKLQQVAGPLEALKGFSLVRFQGGALKAEVMVRVWLAIPQHCHEKQEQLRSPVPGLIPWFDSRLCFCLACVCEPILAWHRGHPYGRAERGPCWHLWAILTNTDTMDSGSKPERAA
jgi:hypothetical protein